MRFLVKRTPDDFVKTVNDEIGTLLNRHFENLMPTFDYPYETAGLSIPIEVEDKEKEYVVKAELPGMKKEDFDIDADKNHITINAKKYEEKNETDKCYKKSEFKYGEFSRSIYFAEETDTNKTEAKYENGILKIVIPKMNSEKETRKKVEIK